MLTTGVKLIKDAGQVGAQMAPLTAAKPSVATRRPRYRRMQLARNAAAKKPQFCQWLGLLYVRTVSVPSLFKLQKLKCIGN